MARVSDPTADLVSRGRAIFERLRGQGEAPEVEEDSSAVPSPADEDSEPENAAVEVESAVPELAVETPADTAAEKVEPEAEPLTWADARAEDAAALVEPEVELMAMP